jgi:hypothetical protein
MIELYMLDHRIAALELHHECYNIFQLFAVFYSLAIEDYHVECQALGHKDVNSLIFEVVIAFPPIVYCFLPMVTGNPSERPINESPVIL